MNRDEARKMREKFAEDRQRKASHRLIKKLKRRVRLLGREHQEASIRGRRFKKRKTT